MSVKPIAVAIAACAATAVLSAQPTSPSKADASLTPLRRVPLADIRSHIDRAWVKDTLVHGLLDYWLKNSIEPNGFIQENLDRNWKPWGMQREASINGQGRQLFTMAIGYELTKDKAYLDGLTRGMDFLMKMRDAEYGGYYDRVAPDLTVITDSKTGFSSFALDSLAHAGRVTGNKKYLVAAMVLFREIRDKMRDGPFIGSGSYTRDFMQRTVGGGAFGGGGGCGQGGRERPRQVAQVRPSVNPQPRWPPAATVSICTCSRRCSRCTKRRSPRRSGTRSRQS